MSDTGEASPAATGPEPVGPELNGPGPTGPDPTGPDTTGPEPGGPEPGGPEPSLDEQAEIARLRAEVEQLRVQQATVRRRHRLHWRAPVATLLVVLGCVFSVLSVVGVWAGNEVSNTDRYVATVEPLIHDPAIQNALTDKITNAITD